MTKYRTDDWLEVKYTDIFRKSGEEKIYRHRHPELKDTTKKDEPPKGYSDRLLRRVVDIAFPDTEWQPWQFGTRY
jgi:hypothetical protein